jgi:hypothetical protein
MKRLGEAIKTYIKTTAIFFFILSFFISGCAPQMQPSTTPANSEAGPTSQPAETQPATLAPTDASTRQYPPVFDPGALGDISSLNNFILTISIARTEDSELVGDFKETLGYIAEPFSVYNTRGDRSGGWFELAYGGAETVRVQARRFALHTTRRAAAADH